MSGIFESKMASYGEVDERLHTLTQAIRAFVDCWAPRVLALEESKGRALRAIGDSPRDSAAHFYRDWIEARYAKGLEELVREGKAHRQTLDRLVEFYSLEGDEEEEEERVLQ